MIAVVGVGAGVADVAAQDRDVSGRIALAARRLVNPREAAVDADAGFQVERVRANGPRCIGALGDPDFVSRIGGGDRALQTGVSLGPTRAVGRRIARQDIDAVDGPVNCDPPARPSRNATIDAALNCE